MRSHPAASVLLAALVGLSGCLPEEQSTADTPPVVQFAKTRAESLRINEVRILGGYDVPDPTFDGALELINSGSVSIRLAAYSVRTDGNDWRLPEVELAPGALYVARALEPVTPSSATFLGQGVEWLALLDDTGRLVDEFHVPASTGGGMLARYSDGIDSQYVYPLDRASVGKPNADLGIVRRLAAGTEFLPRDSSNNAIVTYDDHYWVLGGWSNFGGDDWHSYTDVWKSRDGIRWELVNSSPPYSHYSSFIAWRGRMWVIGSNSFSSTDGIEWRPEAILSPGLNQSVVLGDSLINVGGATVRVTNDGEQWTTLTTSAPWGADRVQPMVVAYDGKIWVMGGVDGYDEPDETYLNDVWTSTDGVDWQLLNPYAAWRPRLWSSAVAYDGKLFVLNGMNTTDWPDEWGNSAEIWFTEDGLDWFPVESELRWGPRHASLTTATEEQGVLLIAGYGHGGVERIYNDVWNLRVAMFFSKPEGDLRDLATWGKHMDGSGDAPGSFDAPGQLFMLRNRQSFAIDESWEVRGAGSRIVVGDGQQTHSVELHITNRARPHHPLQLLANSTTFAHGCSPTVYLKNPQAAFIDQSVSCPLHMPRADGPHRATRTY